MNRLKNLRTILIVIFLIMPLAITSLIYFNNKTFKSKANNLLGKLPGAVGEYFRFSPTEREQEDKKIALANYYLSLDPSIAADKLYVIKINDEKLYSEVIRMMNSNSSSKTEDIIKLVRNMELRKNLLFSIYDEIQEEKKNLFKDEVVRLENQDILSTIKEIESGRISKEDLPEIINIMREDRAVDILYYIDESIKDDIIYSLDDKKRATLDSKLLIKSNTYNTLADLGSLYEVKPIEVAIEEIGNTENYSIEELGIIYKNLSILKSAEILSRLEEDSFIQDLFASIRREERLEGKEDTITRNISKSIQFIAEYNNNIDELVMVYEKMESDKVAKIVEKMMANNNTVTALEINLEPVFEISDASVVIDILSRMRNKKLSSIMNYINDELASKLTQMLVKK